MELWQLSLQHQIEIERNCKKQYEQKASHDRRLLRRVTAYVLTLGTQRNRTKAKRGSRSLEA